MSDYEEYLKAHADVRAWMKDYKLYRVRPFEPLVRNYFAIQANGEMAKFLGKDLS